MFEHKIIQDLDEYFLKQSGRKETGVYFTGSMGIVSGFVVLYRNILMRRGFAAL